MNREHDPYNLPLVVMPLVKLLKDANITWAQRQDIAMAILECIRCYESLMKEGGEHSTNTTPLSYVTTSESAIL